MHSTQGLYFEELEQGAEFWTAERTITESDIVMFGGLTGDYSSLHFSAEAAKNTSFGSVIAHGMLVASYAIGLCARTDMFAGTLLGFMGIDHWDFLKPVFPGDTIKVKIIISDKISSKSKSDRGIVVRVTEVYNQHGELVHRGQSKLMVKRRP
ncbi:MAG: MaoC family dehydratase N-terminal domain-containing protein [Abditibacteriota bacterium]|nr:MaoC family dehydratase N-terminal domain-containing protein [Oscillospiraceae bacterium]MBQ9359190.1 MaoC family dehydratase N-terminal domain-containing protein [Abditibacteriota bacterium]